MNDDFKELHKKLPTLMLIVMILLALGSVVFVFNQVSKKNQNKLSKVEADNEGENVKERYYDKSYTGAITEVNIIAKTFKIKENVFGSEILLSYTGGTEVFDKYDQVITIPQLKIGEIVDVNYLSSENKAVTLEVSKDAWEYKGVGNLQIYKYDNRMEISGQKYQYSDKLITVNENKIIELMDINEHDILTVKGIGTEIYSIIVTKGHGYIRFTNYEQFLDGYVEAGADVMTKVSNDMILVVPEGQYKVKMSKDNLVGEKRVKVVRDEESVLDMGEFMPPPIQTGLVEFKVSPGGSTIYIDGEEVDYSKDIQLEYGEHVIKAEHSNYETFAGLLDVNKPAMTVEINLADPNSSKETTDNSTSNSDNNSSTTITPTITPTPEDKEEHGEDDSESDEEDEKETVDRVDKEHKIVVEKPIAAEVYLDGKLMGIAPVNFEKITGTHTITLRLTGFATKSYTINVKDDSEDVYFSFPDMSVN